MIVYPKDNPSECFDTILGICMHSQYWVDMNKYLGDYTPEPENMLTLFL